MLDFAALASSTDGQDLIDSVDPQGRRRNARAAAARRQWPRALSHSIPPQRWPKRSRSIRAARSGGQRRARGRRAFAPMSAEATAQLDALNHAGYRTLAVAAGPAGALELDRIYRSSAIRLAPDSARLLTELRSLGVRPVMVTGDAADDRRDRGAVRSGSTGQSVRRANSRKRGPERFRRLRRRISGTEVPAGQGVPAAGHAVGMCGDGANDAPALRQAQMGIAVSTATDVAKAAAGMVLTEPGLGGIVACIKEGRSAFQRVLTYTLMILVNKCVTLVVLGAGLDR